METIGFIGLGQMGLPIARRLLDSGYGLRVYNRNPAKADTLVAAGASLAKTPDDAASAGGVVFSIVSDDPALESVAGESLARRLGKGGVHVSMSTVQPDTTARLAAVYAEHGADFLGAPVFGHPSTISAGSLWVMLSGSAAAKARVRPMLEAMSKGIQDLGELPQAANVVKLAGNFLGFAALEALAEASVLAEVNGLPRAALLGALTETVFSAPLYKRFAGQIISADFEQPDFTATLALKDMSYAQRAGANRGATLPTLDILCGRLKWAVDNGLGSKEASILALGAAEEAGLSWQK